MSTQSAAKVYHVSTFIKHEKSNTDKLLPEDVIKKHYPSTRDNVNSFIISLQMVLKKIVYPPAPGTMKYPSLSFLDADFVRPSWQAVKNTLAVDIVKAIEDRQGRMLKAVEQLTVEKKKATAAAQKEAKARGAALAKAMREKDVSVSVSSSPKVIPWTRALEIVEEAERSWKIALINVQILSQDIEDTYVAIDRHVADRSNSQLEMDEHIKAINAALTAVKDKVSKAIEAAEKATDFSSQLDSSL
jgi:hypothetical protein